LTKKDPDGNYIFKDFNLNVKKGEKIAFTSRNPLAISTLFNILNGEDKADSGTFNYGQTITIGYIPNENTAYFNGADNLVDWLRQYSKEKEETYVRGFLGKMLFSGEEVMKKSNVLSGGEKVRCMLSRMMLQNANLLFCDDPTNHLDLESIQALNEGLIEFNGTILFSSHDHEFMQTIANRIIEIGPKGFIDKSATYDEFLEDEKVKAMKSSLY
jgi:ATPase subunit of ABC transporter with duplicated ATPase domains